MTNTIICDFIEHTLRNSKWTIKFFKKSKLNDFNKNHNQELAMKKKKKPCTRYISSHGNEFNTVVEFQIPRITFCNC